jgi:hypothetical protein
MNAKLVEDIASAVLYEGYILYPYRRSAVKNRQRFNFGVLTPREYCDAHPAGENSSFQAECLARLGADSSLNVKVRFLRLVERTVGEISPPFAEFPESGPLSWRAVQSLTVNGRTYEPWQEAAEGTIEVQRGINSLLAAAHDETFALPAVKEHEALRDADGRIAGVIFREQEGISGEVSISAQAVGDGVLKLTVRVSNLTPVQLAEDWKREDALRHSLLSAHAVLNIPGGEFISLFDPPADCQDAASSCHNASVWPVLIGEEGARDAMLASPIILYDYPQIAPESAGDLFDGTEIDEILALRILTLTDEEKQEMRRGDDRARQILERTESLPTEHMMKLHGVLRGIRPANDEAK